MTTAILKKELQKDGWNGWTLTLENGDRHEFRFKQQAMAFARYVKVKVETPK